MTALRMGMIALATLHLLLALGGVFVGSFADGGDGWNRYVIVVVHPVAAVALLAVVAWREAPSPLFGTLVALVLAGVVADAVVAAAIGIGAIKGDWWLPLVFAVVPVIGLAFVLATRRRRHAKV